MSTASLGQKSCVPFTEFYPFIRFMLADFPDENGIYDYSDDQIKAGINAIVCGGLAPACVDVNNAFIPEGQTTAVAAVCTNNNKNLTKAAFGLIGLKVAKQFHTGQPASSFRTRPLSVTVTHSAVALSVNELNEHIYAIENQGGICGEDTTGLNSTIYSIGDAATISTLGVAGFCYH